MRGDVGKITSMACDVNMLTDLPAAILGVCGLAIRFARKHANALYTCPLARTLGLFRCPGFFKNLSFRSISIFSRRLRLGHPQVSRSTPSHPPVSDFRHQPETLPKEKEKQT